MSILKRLRAAVAVWRNAGKDKKPKTSHVDVKLSTFGRHTLTMIESKKLSERLFKGRTVNGASRHANDEGVTLLFIDGTRGDVEACDAVEILKYLD